MSLTLRPMQLQDVSQVVAIDRVAFSTPWSARTYTYEIDEAENSHMLTVEYLVSPPPARGLRRVIHQFLPPAPTPYTVVAYGGLWRFMDEAHISTIASHPQWRGQGYGELALAAMIRRAYLLNAGYIALEVRLSNHAAQQLYIKYGFTIYATKQRYYRDNGEDAYDMRLTLSRAAWAEFEQRFRALQAQRGFTDIYSAPPGSKA
ncbi:MAG: GNAT family N-acetyltransferase [Armatimonadetes bacterium]|nr:GNAT family N-acetyltransferase [Anaerolineae bacterium]